MILRNPQPDPEFKHQFNNVETAKEIPAIPKSSLHPSWYEQKNTPIPIQANWQVTQPKPRYQQDIPIWRESLDLEKVAARLTWLCMGLFALVVMLVCMGKIVMMVWALK